MHVAVMHQVSRAARSADTSSAPNVPHGRRQSRHSGKGTSAMKLHTNSLDALDTAALTANLPGCKLTATRHGSRSHRYAYELTLEGSSLTGGQYGLTPYRTATWDEWGTVIARIYRLDTQAVFGTVKRPTYSDWSDFNTRTDSRFSRDGLPADTHARHKWEYQSPHEFACTICTARKVN